MADWAGVVLFVSAFVWLVLSVRSFIYFVKLCRKRYACSFKTVALVVELKKVQYKDKEVYCPVLEYYIKGHLYSIDAMELLEVRQFMIGDDYEISVDPEHPTIVALVPVKTREAFMKFLHRLQLGLVLWVLLILIGDGYIG